MLSLSVTVQHQWINWNTTKETMLYFTLFTNGNIAQTTQAGHKTRTATSTNYRDASVWLATWLLVCVSFHRLDSDDRKQMQRTYPLQPLHCDSSISWKKRVQAYNYLNWKRVKAYIYTLEKSQSLYLHWKRVQVYTYTEKVSKPLFILKKTPSLYLHWKRLQGYIYTGKNSKPIFTLEKTPSVNVHGKSPSL